jgi:hypothetical protein
MKLSNDSIIPNFNSRLWLSTITICTVQSWATQFKKQPTQFNSIQFMNLVELNCQKFFRIYELNWVGENFRAHWIELNWIGQNLSRSLNRVGNFFQDTWIELNWTKFFEITELSWTKFSRSLNWVEIFLQRIELS